MAFGGSAGAPANVLPSAALVSPFGTVTVASGIARFSAIGGPGKNFQTLICDLVFSGTPALDAYVNVTTDGSAADTGVLVSAAPAANQHGIPINFGPGRDNWGANEVNRLKVSIERQLFTYVANRGCVVPMYILSGQGPNGRDIAIGFKNQADISIVGLRIMVQYMHSIIL